MLQIKRICNHFSLTRKQFERISKKFKIDIQLIDEQEFIANEKWPLIKAELLKGVR